MHASLDCSLWCALMLATRQSVYLSYEGVHLEVSSAENGKEFARFPRLLAVVRRHITTVVLARRENLLE